MPNLNCFVKQRRGVFGHLFFYVIKNKTYNQDLSIFGLFPKKSVDLHQGKIHLYICKQRSKPQMCQAAQKICILGHID